jgi:hypothetical protein
MQETPEMTKLRGEIVSMLGNVKIAALQAAIDDMKKQGQYKQYVQQRKLGLLMGDRGEMLDKLLVIGVLK